MCTTVSSLNSNSTPAAYLNVSVCLQLTTHVLNDVDAGCALYSRVLLCEGADSAVTHVVRVGSDVSAPLQLLKLSSVLTLGLTGALLRRAQVPRRSHDLWVGPDQ